MVTPLALTVLLLVPAFLSRNAWLPVLLTTSPAAAPAIAPTTPEPLALNVPSYVLVNCDAVTVKAAGFMVLVVLST